jgi:hypothetical protein
MRSGGRDAGRMFFLRRCRDSTRHRQCRKKVGLRSSPSYLLAALILCVIFIISRISAANSAEIVVYYANETTPQAAHSPNTTRLLAILERSANPAARGMVKPMLGDEAKFGAAVRADETALISAARQRGFELILFTNALALDHKFLVLRNGGDFESLPLPDQIPAPSPALATSPLARPEYLAAALNEVAALHPQHPVDVILITNSHGAGDLALTPRIFADLALAKASELEHERETPPEIGKPPPLWAAYPGTTKAEYWRILANAKGLRFALVVRDSCESGMSSWRELLALFPVDLTALVHTGDAVIDYGAIAFQTAFAGNPSDPTLATGLASGLQRQGLYVSGKNTLIFGFFLRRMAALPAALYFAPIALWLCWFGWAVLTARQRRAMEEP